MRTDRSAARSLRADAMHDVVSSLAFSFRATCAQCDTLLCYPEEVKGMPVSADSHEMFPTGAN